MAKKRKIRGHYCKICNTFMANEKFLGKGHAGHICKKCSKLSIEERKDRQTINRIYNLYRFTYLSKTNRALLMKYCNYKSEKVRAIAKEVLDDFNTAMMEWKAARELEEQAELECFANYTANDEENYNKFEYDQYDGVEEEWSDEDDEIPF